MGTPIPDKDNHISCRWDEKEQRYITLAEDWQTRSEKMQKFDVWVYLPTEEGKTDDDFVGTFTGYISEITAAVLALYPSAVGIYCVPENTG